MKVGRVCERHGEFSVGPCRWCEPLDPPVAAPLPLPSWLPPMCNTGSAVPTLPSGTSFTLGATPRACACNMPNRPGDYVHAQYYCAPRSILMTATATNATSGSLGMVTGIDYGTGTVTIDAAAPASAGGSAGSWTGYWAGSSQLAANCQHLNRSLNADTCADCGMGGMEIFRAQHAAKGASYSRWVSLPAKPITDGQVTIAIDPETIDF